MRMIEVVLAFYNIKADKVFSNEHAFKVLDQKFQQPCKCGNRSYLLYFIDLALPVLKFFYQFY